MHTIRLSYPWKLRTFDEYGDQSQAEAVRLKSSDSLVEFWNSSIPSLGGDNRVIALERSFNQPTGIENEHVYIELPDCAKYLDLSLNGQTIEVVDSQNELQPLTEKLNQHNKFVVCLKLDTSNEKVFEAVRSICESTRLLIETRHQKR